MHHVAVGPYAFYNGLDLPRLPFATPSLRGDVRHGYGFSKPHSSDLAVERLCRSGFGRPRLKSFVRALPFRIAGTSPAKLPEKCSDPFRSGMSSIIFAIISSGFSRPSGLARSPSIFFHHCARRERYFVVEPPIRRFDHGLVEAGQEWPWIDRLYLNAERAQFVLHRFCDRLHGVLCGRIGADHRRAYHAEYRGQETTLPCVFERTQRFTTRCVKSSGAKTFTSKFCRTRSMGISLIGPPSPMPALLTSTSKSHRTARPTSW